MRTGPKRRIPIKPEAEEILLKAQDSLPVTIQSPTNPSELPQKASLTPPREMHPLAVGLREAKVSIANILKNPENQKKLAVCLQAEFDMDPSGFVRRYEPLLRRFEESVPTDQRGPIRVFLKGEAVISVDPPPTERGSDL